MSRKFFERDIGILKSCNLLLNYNLENGGIDETRTQTCSKLVFEQYIHISDSNDMIKST
jgi:hypothetical protein